MHSYLARQPILDGDQKLAAYELLYRSSEANLFPEGTEEVATCRVLQSALIQFGLDELSAEHRVYINLGERALLQGSYRMLPQDRVMVELLEDVPPSPEVVRAVTGLKREGYSLALDDFTFREDYQALIRLADVIKVDLRETDRWNQARAVQALLDQGKQLLAEKVESHEEFRQARDLGYTRFQGYFFSRPQLLKARDITGNILYYTRLLEQVSRLDLDLDTLENTISSDLSLSWKLLRYINSAAMARRQQISSIRQAMLLLGEAQLRRWASVVAVSELNKGHSQELLKLCLVRARFCETLYPLLKTGAAMESEAFLVGLLSGLDAMLDMEMGQALPVLNLGSHLNRALLEHEGPLSPVLELVLAWEQDDPERVASLCRTHRLDAGALPACYRRAVEWVAEALRED